MAIEGSLEHWMILSELSWWPASLLQFMTRCTELLHYAMASCATVFYVTARHGTPAQNGDHAHGYCRFAYPGIAADATVSCIALWGTYSYKSPGIKHWHTCVCEQMITLLSVSRWPHFCLWADDHTCIFLRITTLLSLYRWPHFICVQLTTLLYVRLALKGSFR